MPEDDNATATRMAKEAAARVAETVQEVVADVADTHAGAPPAQVKDALKTTWADKLPDSAPPLPEDKAEEIAGHISAERDVIVAPTEPKLAPESDG